MELNHFFPIWDQLTADQQQRLAGSARLQQIAKGTIVHNGSLDCSGLLLIRSGQLRAYILSPEGKEITVYRLFSGDLCLFSASCMLRSIQFDITVEAEKDTGFFLIPPDVYRRAMDGSAALANYTSEIMASRFSEVMWLMEQVLWQSFDRRLAAFLISESAIEGTLTLKLTHEAIGNHLGNPREVVTRMLKYFQDEGLVSLSRGTIRIEDPKRLRQLAGQ